MIKIELNMRFPDGSGDNTRDIMLPALPPVGATIYIPWKNEKDSVKVRHLDCTVHSFHVIADMPEFKPATWPGERADNRLYNGRISMHLVVNSDT